MAKKRKVNGHSAIDEYQHRFRLVRIAVAGDSQRDFAEKVGIDMKRWNNFERGFPVPRDIAIHLCRTLEGLSLDWLFLNNEKHLSPEWRARIRDAERRLKKEG